MDFDFILVYLESILNYRKSRKSYLITKLFCFTYTAIKKMAIKNKQKGKDKDWKQINTFLKKDCPSS